MVPELEKPRVTEIQVRMDCNGCVQKIKKALHGINGIYDIYIDIPRQKLTIIGWADPEKIIKAIKKTRKTVIICSHSAPLESEPPQEGEAPNPPEEEAPQEEKTPPTEPPPPPENQPPDAAEIPPQPTESTLKQPPKSVGPTEGEEVHVVYHYPPDHRNNDRVYSGRVDHYLGSQGGPVFKHEPPQPIHVNHSYNTYKPIPYVTRYEYIPPPPQYVPSSRPEPLRRYASYTWPESPQEYTHYNRSEPQPRPYSRPEPPPQPYSRPEPTPSHYGQPEPTPQDYSQPEQTPRDSHPEPPAETYSRPKPPQPYSRTEPPPQPYNRPEPPPQSYNRPEPPPQSYNGPEPPPQPYSRPEPPPSQHYSRPEPPSPQRYSQQDPLEQNQTDTPQYYRQPEAPQIYTHYNRSEPPLQYSHYIHPESQLQYTQHSRVEPSTLHTYYSRPEPHEYRNYNDYYSSYRDDETASPFGDEDPNGCRIA